MKNSNQAKNILTHSRHLQNLLHKCRDQQRISNIIKQLLPDQLKNHCTGANLDNNQLTIFADSSIWASRLRYESSNLKQHLGQHGLHPQTISIRVRQLPVNAVTSTKKPARPVLSTSTSSMLHQTADCLDDSALADALRRLAKHT